MGHGDGVLITVWIGRFRPLVQAGIVQALLADKRLLVAGAGLTQDALLRVDDRPGVAVVDAADFVSVAALSDFLEAMSPAQTLVVSDPASEQVVSALMTTGPGSCIPSDCADVTLRDSVALCSQGLQVRVPLRALRNELTYAEERVLTLIRVGHSNGEIAAALHVSVETVRTHARQIYRKLEVPGREALRLVDSPEYPRARRRA